MEQRNRLPAAHQQTDRDSNAKRPRYPLRHDKARRPQAVIKADEAKEETCQKTVNGIGFQIFRACRDNGRVLCENTAQYISAKEGEQAHTDAKDK